MKREGRRSRWLWPRWVALVALLAAYLATVPTGCLCDRVILGRPGPPAADLAGATRHVIHADGRAIEYAAARSPGARDGREPAALVLFFVGKGDFGDRWTSAVAGSWGRRPVEVWGMNYPGFGGSDGPPRLDRVVPEALAFYDAARAAAGDRPIYIHAGSFGTTVAMAVAARRPVAGLVLQNPPPLRQLITGHYGWWNLWLIAGPMSRQIPPELDSLANASRVHAPAVFLCSGADATIPPEYHRRVINACAGPHHLIDIPAAGHSDPLPRDAAAQLDREMDWLWEHAP
jgi:alpha-beta hydrolase superfamily lysophospholipase